MRVPVLVGRRVLIQRPIRGPIWGPIRGPTGDSAVRLNRHVVGAAVRAAAAQRERRSAPRTGYRDTPRVPARVRAKATPARAHSARQGAHNGPSAAQRAAGNVPPHPAPAARPTAARHAPRRPTISRAQPPRRIARNRVRERPPSGGTAGADPSRARAQLGRDKGQGPNEPGDGESPSTAYRKPVGTLPARQTTGTRRSPNETTRNTVQPSHHDHHDHEHHHHQQRADQPARAESTTTDHKQSLTNPRRIGSQTCT